MRTLGFILRKEFKQIYRDQTMLRMLIAMPLIQLLILSSAATFEVREGRAWFVDLDQSAASRGLVQRVLASGRFVAAGSSLSMTEANDALLGRKAGVVLRIPRDFERDLAEGAAEVQLVFDAEDGAAAGVLQSYLASILGDHATELGGRIPTRVSTAGIDVRFRGWYNPRLDYNDYMVPGILVVLVTIIAMSITSMNIVREKEIGTLEQLNVTPITRSQFVAGKLIPFWLISLLNLAMGLALARAVYGIPMEGNLLLVFAAAVLYLLVALGIGLWISTLVETQQQAMFIAFAVNMVYLLMSGLFTPVSSMPDWAQVCAQFSPGKHFIEIMRTVLIRGGGVEAIARPAAILAVYGTVVFTLAVRQYSKTTA